MSFCLVLAGFLFFIPSASAYSKTVTQTSGEGSDYEFDFSNERILGQSFLATSTNLNALALKISGFSGAGRIMEIKICAGDFSTTATYAEAAGDWNCDHPGQKPIFDLKPDWLSVPGGDSAWVDVDFPHPVAVAPGQRYFFLFKTAQMRIRLNSQYVDSYPAGEARFGGINVSDIIFKLYYAAEPVAWPPAVPEKAEAPAKDEYYVSGSSLKLGWTTPNAYEEIGTVPAYEIEYWKKSMAANWIMAKDCLA